MKNLIFILILIPGLLTFCKKDKEEEVKIEDIIVYQTTFDYDNNTWNKDSTSRYIRKYKQGNYVIEVDTTDWLVWSFAPYGLINYKYSISVDCKMQLNDTSKLGYTGIIYNYINNNNYSILRICNNGTYNLYQVINGNYNTLIDFTSSSAIKVNSGEVNNIKLIQKDSTTEIVINNNLIGSFPFAKQNGYVLTGVSTCSYLGVNFTKVIGIYDNFIIKKLL